MVKKKQDGNQRQKLQISPLLFDGTQTMYFGPHMHACTHTLKIILNFSGN